MAIKEVHLISRNGTSSAVTMTLDVRAIAANLYLINRPLKKAGLPELKPLFEADDQTWSKAVEVLRILKSARAFFNDHDLLPMPIDIVQEELECAIESLQSLPKKALVRLEVIRTKPQKQANLSQSELVARLTELLKQKEDKP